MQDDGERECERCHGRYHWRRSTSGCLKMTFCSVLCERGALGFTIETVLHGMRVLRSDWAPLLRA